MTFLSGVAAADIGDQAWIVILAFTAAHAHSALIATLTVAAGTVPRAILDLVGGAIADRLPTRPLLIGAAGARVLALAAGLIAVITFPDRSIPIVVGVAILFGAADAVHKPATFTMPRQIVGVDHVVRAASLRQLINRLALLGGPALAGAVLAAVALKGALAGLLVMFVLAAVLLSLVRVRYVREESPRESVLSSLRGVIEFLRTDTPSRALVLSMIGLNFFVIPVVNIGVALKAHDQGWSADVLGILMACVGVGAAIGTLITLRIKPRYPMRFALTLLVLQGVALGLVGLLPMVGVGVALGLVGLTAGLASPMLAGTAQAIVPSNYLGRVFAVVGLADDALIPIALVGYGLVTDRIGLSTTTVICGIGMMVLMALGLLRRPLRGLRLERPDQTAAEPAVEVSEQEAPADSDGDDPASPSRAAPRRALEPRALNPRAATELPGAGSGSYGAGPGQRDGRP